MVNRNYSTDVDTIAFRISLPGYKVQTATPEQCVVHSQYPTPKVNMNADPLHYGLVSVALVTDPVVDTTRNLFTMAHGYSYIPTAIVVYNDPSAAESRQYGAMPYFINVPTSFRAYCDATSFKIDMVNNSFAPVSIAPRTIQFRYYIYCENGA